MYRLVFMLSSLKYIYCANILIVSEMTSLSEHFWNFNYAKSLFTKGHNVTMLSPHSMNVSMKNFHHILSEGTFDQVVEKYPPINFGFADVWETLISMSNYEYDCCAFTFNSNGFKSLLVYPEDFKFDLIAIDVTTGGLCFIPLIKRFNYPPTVGITAFILPPFISYYFGNHFHSYLPLYTYHFAEDVTFLSRMRNTFLFYFDICFKHYFENPRIEALHKSTFGFKVDSVKFFHRYLSLVFANIVPLLHPQPVTPNIISVGGLHFEPSKKLPKDIAIHLDNADNGAIIFSMGSYIKSSTLTMELRRVFINVFAQLPYTVFWKFESDLMTSENVIIKNWLPLNDMLAHKNTKLFITHGGSLSTQEAVYHGVPVMGIPVFLDQHLNTQLMVKHQLGTQLRLKEITFENLLEKINETIKNPAYKNNMKKFSCLFRDLPENPVDKVVEWTEYAIKHNGTNFLNTKARDLAFFQAESLDVIFAIMGICLFIIVVIFYLLLKLIYRISSKIKTD